MTITNVASGTNVHEIADSIYRISTPINNTPHLPHGWETGYLVEAET